MGIGRVFFFSPVFSTKNNQRLRSTQNFCDSLWDACQNVKTNTTKTNNVMINHLTDLMQPGSRLDWSLHLTLMMIQQLIHHWEQDSAPGGDRGSVAFWFTLLFFIMSPCRKGEKQTNEGSPPRDSNLLRIDHSPTKNDSNRCKFFQG